MVAYEDLLCGVKTRNRWKKGRWMAISVPLLLCESKKSNEGVNGGLKDVGEGAR